ncbi:hypothetical protein E3O42_01125 [Cryobacterium adonitolivorans]|uniref:DUF2178 domain-containing protein n=2 Tax=Cryobacterium adonitolivorans TaxID=1259189 RepID=A0A4V3IDJ1_9MICO|nr:hypothetical protein E3O42_01125 [Cryobacterium adonitolivorans]
MAHEEQRAWIMAGVTIIAYGIYLGWVLGGAHGEPLAEVPYAAAMLWTIGGAIVGSILLNIVAAILSPRDATAKDQRDTEIHRTSQYIGQSFVILGAVLAMLFALAEVGFFWIANVIYLGFMLSALLGSVAKIVAYRRGFQSW